uniref:Uncharacterized protein n=1 Tax=Cucumis sativus TaxID=3659 RepID=A0A0A0K567_CUCSA
MQGHVWSVGWSVLLYLTFKSGPPININGDKVYYNPRVFTTRSHSFPLPYFSKSLPHSSSSMLALLPRLLLCINLQEEPYHSTFTYLSCSSSNMASTDADALASSFSVEKQFEHFRAQLQDSGSLCDCIRSVAMEIESSTRLMHASLLLIHHSRLTRGIEFLFA